MALFPAWVPTEPLLVFFVVLIVAVLAMNKGRTWFVNVLAMDEPFLVALGALVAALGPWLSANVGGESLWWLVIGAAISLFGIYAFRSDRVDVSGLIG